MEVHQRDKIIPQKSSLLPSMIDKEILFMLNNTFKISRNAKKLRQERQKSNEELFEVKFGNFTDAKIYNCGGDLSLSNEF